jgi:hypothetical protein
MRKNRGRLTLAGIVALSAPILGAVVGCNNADQPKLADAPPVQPSPAAEPPKIPGQAKPFTKVDGYSKYMSKGGQSN